MAKEKFYAAKEPINILDVKVGNIVISKLVKTKTHSKYLTGIKFDKAASLLVLIVPKISGYVITFKVKEAVKDKTSKLISFRTEKLSEKYEAIWTKIENLKNIELNALPVGSVKWSDLMQVS